MSRKIYLSLEVATHGQTVNSFKYNYRDFIYPSYRLFHRDLVSQRNKSKLEILWNLLDPIVLSCIFIVMHSFRAISVDTTTLPYAMFVISGVLFWHSICDALVKPMSVIKKHKVLLENTDVNPRILWGSSLIDCFYNSSFRLAVILLSSLYFGIDSFLSLLAYAGYFYFILYIFHSIGVSLSPFNYLTQSLERVVNIILRPLFFVSGVVFPLPNNELIEVFSTYNVFTVIIDFGRQLLVWRFLDNIEPIAIHIAILVLLMLVGFKLFHSSVRVVVDKS